MLTEEAVPIFNADICVTNNHLHQKFYISVPKTLKFVMKHAVN